MGDSSAPKTTFLRLPQELRDSILALVLRDSPVYITQWACSRSAVAHLQGLTTRLTSIENPTSASASLDFFARSNVSQVNHQLRHEATDVLRSVGYHIYVATHCRLIESFLLVSPKVLQRIDALYLTDACRCSERSGTEDIHDSRHSILRDKISSQMPRLRHLYLGASTTLAAVDLEMTGLYLSFFESLREHRLHAIYVECGTVSKGNYAADVDYERSWLLGPPRVRHRSQHLFHVYQMLEVARRKALRDWLVCRDMPGYVNAFWPLPFKRAGGLRFILQAGEPRSAVSEAREQ